MENIYNHYRNIVVDACLRIDELKIVEHEEGLAWEGTKNK